MRFLFFPIIFLFASCATPVTKKQWDRCEDVCQRHKGVKEACDELFRGQGCHCVDDKIIWLEE